MADLPCERRRLRVVRVRPDPVRARGRGARLRVLPRVLVDAGRGPRPAGFLRGRQGLREEHARPAPRDEDDAEDRRRARSVRPDRLARRARGSPGGVSRRGPEATRDRPPVRAGTDGLPADEGGAPGLRRSEAVVREGHAVGARGGALDARTHGPARARGASRPREGRPALPAGSLARLPGGRDRHGAALLGRRARRRGQGRRGGVVAARRFVVSPFGVRLRVA